MRGSAAISLRSELRLLLLSAADIALVPLSAVPAVACHDAGSPWNTIYKPNGSDWLGVQVSSPGMAIYNGDVSCGRVSSLFVRNSDWTRWVEVGWIENAGSHYACVPDTNGPPKILAYAKFDGMTGCKNPASDLSEGTDGFKVHDDNQNGVWRYFHSGNEVWTSFDMSPFNSGLVEDNGERLNFSNTAHSDFDGLTRMNSSGSFTDWNSTDLHDGDSDDSGSHGCKYSDTHTAVKLNGTPC